MPTSPVATLASGTKVPQVAFGVGAIYKKEFSQEQQDGVLSAIKNGYRHFDGGEIYNTEVELGNAIKLSGVPRSEFFITSKVNNLGWKSDPKPDIEQSLRRSLETLGTDYIDLYLIHNPWFPPNSLTIAEAWGQMENVKEKGLAKEIGISNFEPVDIEKLLKIARIKPAINQIEVHPYIWAQSQEVISFCKSHSIFIAGYCPLLPIGRLNKGPLPALLDEIAIKYDKTPAQILLRWQIQKGFGVVTYSSKPERQASQLDLDFELKEEDIDLIQSKGAEYPVRFFGWGPFKKEYKSVL